MKSLLVNTLFVGLVLNTGTQGINLTPKQLDREISKISGCEKPASTEIKSNVGIAIDTSEGRFFKYNNAFPIEYSYVGRVHTCRAEGCTSPNILKTKESSEFFDYFILFDSAASVISVQVFNYEATHGQEITVKGWLKQFVGYTAGNELTVGKEIDAIAGATISAHNICGDIMEKTTALKNQVQNIQK